MGCQRTINPIGQRVLSGCVEGGWVKGLEEGEGVEWPLVLMEVKRCKTIKKHLLPTTLLSQWCRSHSLFWYLSCSWFFLGNNHYADPHYEAGPSAACCSLAR